MTARARVLERWSTRFVVPSLVETESVEPSPSLKPAHSRLARALARKWPGEDGDDLLARTMRIAAQDEHPRQMTMLRVLLKELQL